MVNFNFHWWKKEFPIKISSWDWKSETECAYKVLLLVNIIITKNENSRNRKVKIRGKNRNVKLETLLWQYHFETKNIEIKSVIRSLGQQNNK